MKIERTYIVSCMLIKPAKLFSFFFPQNLIFLCPGIFWEMHVLLLLVYLGTMMYIRQTFQIETAFIMYYNIISSIETHIRGPCDPGSLT